MLSYIPDSESGDDTGKQAAKGLRGLHNMRIIEEIVHKLRNLVQIRRPAHIDKQGRFLYVILFLQYFFPGIGVACRLDGA
jgi:hypothetical protein